MATDVQALRQAASTQPVRAGFFDAAGFELMQRVAKAFATSSLVPKEYQGNIANCMIAINMAERIGADPMMVMQNLYIVHGRPGWSAQFLIATFNHCGRFSALRYEWSGAQGKDDWGCRAWAIERETGERIEGPVISIELAKKEKWYDKPGSKWQSIPQLMLMYRAAAWMIRANAPEIAMGLQTTEELHDVIDVERGTDGVYKMTSDDVSQASQPQAVNQETGEILPGDADPAPETTPTATDAPAVDFQYLLKRIKAATDLDVLDADATQIDDVMGLSQREELKRAYKARRAELEAQQ